MEWLLKRLTEPSTWVGLGAVVGAAGSHFDINEAPAVAETLSATGQAAASGAPWYMWAPLAIGGLVGVFLKEKGGEAPEAGKFGLR